MNLNESIVEGATLEWFSELGYAIEHGPQAAPDGAIPTPDDVFGPAPRISVASSPNLVSRSPNLVSRSPNLDGKRGADGCLIADAMIESDLKQ